MEHGDIQRLRRNNRRLSVVALLCGPAIVSFATSFSQTNAALQWLPYQYWVYQAFPWVSTLLASLGQALQQVILVQILVWWVWKQSKPGQRRVGIVLMVAFGIGTALSLYGLLMGHQIVAPPGVYDGSEYISLFAIFGTWTTCATAMFWITLKGAQPALGICLMDVANGDENQTNFTAQRTWSIRGLLLTTLVIAALIALYQAVSRYQATSNDLPWDARMGWRSLVRILSYCLVNIIVLWSAVRYRMGQSRLLGFGMLFIATTIAAGSERLSQILIGTAYLTPIGSNTIVESAILISATFTLHVLLFRRWEQAGYQLIRIG